MPAVFRKEPFGFRRPCASAHWMPGFSGCSWRANVLANRAGRKGFTALDVAADKKQLRARFQAANGGKGKFHTH